MRWRRAPIGLWLRLGAPAAASGVGGGLLAAFAAAWLLRLVGWTLAVMGVLLLAVVSYATLLVPRLALWRERRWLTRRQRALGPPPQRPSA